MMLGQMLCHGAFAAYQYNMSLMLGKLRTYVGR